MIFNASEKEKKSNFRNIMLIFYFLLPLIFLVAPNGSLAQEEEEEEEEEEATLVGERPRVSVGILPLNYEFKGIVDATTWLSAPDSIGNLTTIEPEEGGIPAGRTVLKILANQKDIIIAARCFDDDPNGIVSFSKARDSDLEEEDHLLLVFDTFLDGRSGYVFAVNPSGARFDGLVVEHGEDVSREWDTIWEAKTFRDESGWYAAIRIPIKSISFKKDLTSWGFNVHRRVQRLQETSRWSGAKRDYEIYQTSRAGLLTNLPNFDFGMGLSARASLVSRTSQMSGEDTEFKAEPSLDITQRLGPNLLGALTINTDFAETEVDVRQINLTRFPLFFPEKRSFFLEGSDIFEFGVGLDEETLIPFHSRRIGLLGLSEEDQTEVPINGGSKINGRMGNTNIGALVVNTRQTDSLQVGDTDEDSTINVPQTTMGSVRISQNILEESSIGMLANFGDQLGRSNSWTAGLDFTYRTSNFLDEKNFIIGFWGLRNNREALEGDKAAYGFRIDYPNDLWDINLTSIRIGDGFDPSLSFVPRNNIHIWDFSTEYRPRPSWEMVRLMTYELDFRLFNRLDNSDWESYEGAIKPLSWLLESGDSFEGGFSPEGDRPPETFEVSGSIDIPADSYQWLRYFLGLNLAQKRMIGGNILWEFGDYYNGNLNTIEASLLLKPSSFLILELSGERNTGTMQALPDDYEEGEPYELSGQDFTEELYGLRFLLNFSPNLQLSSLTQYDTQSREFGSNNKLRWTFHPFGDIFLVYNHNMIRRRENNRWEFVSSEFPLKIQYTYRF